MFQRVGQIVRKAIPVFRTAVAETGTADAKYPYDNTLAFQFPGITCVRFSHDTGPSNPIPTSSRMAQAAA